MTIVLGFALYETIGFVLASEALTVTRITVQGNQRMSRGEVLGLLDGLSGASIVMTDLESWRQKLLESPWVADASIRRMFPGTLAIVIEERQPIGIGRIKGRLFLIDEMGGRGRRVRAQLCRFGSANHRRARCDGGENESVDERRAALAGRLMSELAHQPMLAGQVSQIDVSDVRNAVVTLKADTALLRVGDERFSERLQSYLDLRPALRERMPDIDYVDLRFDSRVYVRPRSARLRAFRFGEASPPSRVRCVGTAGSERRPAVVASPARRLGAEGVHVARREQYVVGLDVGTSTVICVVGESLEDGSLNVVGIGVSESRGIKRGVVVNLEAAVESIKKAIEEAELMGGIEIDFVHLALSGPHIKGFNSRGVVAVAGKNREVTRDDVRRAIDAAKAVALPTGREILHVLPQDFVVDEQDGIGAPEGMTGARLEVNVHVVTGAMSSTQNIVACVNRAGVQVVDTVIEQLAGAEAVLTPDEKELGVALVDIGGGTVDLGDLRARPSVAHGGRCCRRRSFHQRHRRWLAHSDSRR